MKQFYALLFIGIITPNNCYSFNNIYPQPNYSNYTVDEITSVFNSTSTISKRHKIVNFIGWQKSPYIYLDLDIENTEIGRVCISSLKREAGEISWPLEIILFENNNTTISIIEKFRFNDNYNDLFSGNATSQACSDNIILNPKLKIGIITSGRYTFIGKISIERISDIDDINAANTPVETFAAVNLNDFFNNYRKKILISLETYFDENELPKKAKQPITQENKNVIIWHKDLDKPFRRNTVEQESSQSFVVYIPEGQSLEASFGLKKPESSFIECITPVINNGATIESVSEYEYVSATGLGQIAEKLKPLKYNIHLNNESKEIVVKIKANKEDDIVLNFNDCTTNNTIKHFKFQPRYLSFDSDLDFPVLLWPYQNTWPIEASYNVFEDLKAHHSQIIALQGVYVPRLDNSQLNTSSFDRLNTILPKDFDVIFFTFLQHKLWRLHNPGFESENPEWQLNQQNWANKLIAITKENNRNFYLAIVDEPKTDNDFDIARKYYDFFKDRPDNLNIFTTISSGISIPSIVKASLFSDIIALEVSLASEIFINAAKLTGRDVWLYSSRNVGRKSDPLTEYRYLAWIVYINNLSGLGVWNYSNFSTTTGNSLSDYDITGSNFNLVYIEKNNIYPSKRYESLRRGIEDVIIARTMEKFIDKNELINAFKATMLKNESGDYLRTRLASLAK